MQNSPSPTYKAVLKRFEQSTSSVQWYLDQLPNLVKDFPWEVSLAWVFLRVEQAHNRALYIGVVKRHKAHRDIAERAINGHHMTREEFHRLFENVFGHPLSKATREKFAEAARVRDQVVHGKEVLDAAMRKALVDLIEYAELFSAEVNGHEGVEPFGDMRGFKGRATSLDKSTSKWLLKGIGFPLS